MLKKTTQELSESVKCIFYCLIFFHFVIHALWTVLFIKKTTVFRQVKSYVVFVNGLFLPPVFAIMSMYLTWFSHFRFSISSDVHVANTTNQHYRLHCTLHCIAIQFFHFIFRFPIDISYSFEKFAKKKKKKLIHNKLV